MKRKNFYIIIIFLVTFFITVGYILIDINKENEVLDSKEYKTLSQSISTNNQTNTEEKKYLKDEVIEEYKGFEVCAKLEIPSINLETYVLKNYSEDALNVSVTKFYGVDPNNIGNFCVAGHNFINKNMFRRLKNVDIGEKIIISENNIGRVEYEIFDKFKVIPEDTSCLSQNTNGEREITLITCTNTSEERIIVKAKEVN